MRIKITKSFRNLIEGDIYSFNYFPCVISGCNGCGKTSLLLALRGLKNSEKETSLNNNLSKFKDNIEVESKYEKIYFYNDIEDNTSDFKNSFDAYNYMTNGGYHCDKLSHGQGTLFKLNKKLEGVLQNYVPGKTLLVLDEIDNGLDIKAQKKFVNLVYNIQTNYNIDIMIVSHSYIIIKYFLCVYDFENKKDVISSKYLDEID